MSGFGYVDSDCTDARALVLPQLEQGITSLWYTLADEERALLYLSFHILALNELEIALDDVATPNESLADNKLAYEASAGFVENAENGAPTKVAFASLEETAPLLDADVRRHFQSFVCAKYKWGLSFASTSVYAIGEYLGVDLTPAVIDFLKGEMFLGRGGAYYFAEMVLPDPNAVQSVLQQVCAQVEEHRCVSLPYLYIQCSDSLLAWNEAEQFFPAFIAHIIHRNPQKDLQLVELDHHKLCAKTSACADLESSLRAEISEYVDGGFDAASLAEVFPWLELDTIIWLMRQKPDNRDAGLADSARYLSAVDTKNEACVSEVSRYV